MGIDPGVSRLGGEIVSHNTTDARQVSACRKVEVAGARCKGRKRKTWYECVEDDMKALGLHPEWAGFRDMWRGFISGRTSNPS